MKVNVSTSFIVYICKTAEEAQEVGNIAFSAIPTGKDWYSQMSICEVKRDCRVPEFFHDHGYWMAAIGHNKGDWNSEPDYTLYLVG